MTNHTLVHVEEERQGAAVAFVLCSISGCLVGFIMGLVAAWL